MRRRARTAPGLALFCLAALLAAAADGLPPPGSAPPPEPGSGSGGPAETGPAPTARPRGPTTP